MITPAFRKILTTTALCLAAVGLSSCSCQQRGPLLEESLYVNDTSDWYAAENDMSNFYHVTALPSVRESYLNDFRQSSDASSQEFGRKRESRIREMDAAAAFICNMRQVEKEALALVYFEEYVASLDKHHITNSGQLHANNGCTNISNWDGMYTRTVARLPQEQQIILNTKGGAELMEGYGGYMIARYVAFNPKMDAGMRQKALFIVDLWNECSDGENGYRSRWIRRKH